MTYKFNVVKMSI